MSRHLPSDAIELLRIVGIRAPSNEQIDSVADKLGELYAEVRREIKGQIDTALMLSRLQDKTPLETTGGASTEPK